MMFKLVLLLVTMLGVAAKILSKSSIDLDGTIVAAQVRKSIFIFFHRD